MSTHTPIASQTLSSAAASVTFSNIPQTYTDLVLVCNIAQVASNNSLRIRYNSDTGSNYSYTQLQGDGSSAVSGRDSNLTSGLVAETTASTSLDLAVIAHIQNYSNTTTYKTLIGRGNRVSSLVDATASLWRSTAAITTIDLAMGSGFPANNFSSGSTFNLYGIANASITNTAKATGGDSVTTDGTYWYHTFRTSGTFTPTETLTADYLVVAGGAGGGAGINADGNGGGGGAGGLRCTVQATGGGGSLPSALSLTAQAYTVTVGAGGAAATSGSNSVFSSITSTGGGTGGKTGGTNSGASGGSGGGVYNDGAGQGSVGSGTADEGFNGAKSSPTAPYFGGGGGGAGEAGNTDARGDGGDGISTNISGSSVNYAGGGGGGVNAQSAISTGGTGGGGNGGSNNTLAQSGTVNTGGAGGGGAAHTSFIAAGAGGSGIVIVRYAV